jgi:hypothetical protein
MHYVCWNVACERTKIETKSFFKENLLESIGKHYAAPGIIIIFGRIQARCLERHLLFRLNAPAKLQL